jgi:putative ABC transport system permease protein
METLLQDLKYAVRMFLKNPGFAAVAVLTLALGIGASCAVFSVVNGVLLKPLPYREAHRIVMLWRRAPIASNFGIEAFPWGKLDFRFLLEHAQKSFQDLAAFKGDTFNLTGAGEPVRLDGIRAYAGFFPALGVSPVLGRAFTPEEDRPGQEREVILSHRLWQERFGGDRAILGRAIELNGEAYTVIGVMPAGFAFPRAEEMPAFMDLPREAQLWVPLDLPDEPRGPSDLAVMARLRPGVTPSQAQAELDAFARWEEEQFPQGKGWFDSSIKPLALQVAGDTRRPLLLLLGAVGVVLLISCANVANLLLARSFARGREFALRSALGARQWRLARQLLTESILLSLLGGSAGLLLGEAAVRVVKTFGPLGIPRLDEVALDLRVFGFTLAIALVTGVLFGLAPALSATRRNLSGAIQETGQRSGGSLAASRLRHSLLVSEVALALVLVIASGLLVRTLFNMLRTNAGFDSTRVLTFQLSLPGATYTDTERMAQLYTRVLQNLQNLPGVQAAGLVSEVPMGGEPDSTVIRIPGHVETNENERPYANYLFASPGYFSAVGTPLLRGRDFRPSDTLDAEHVVIINAAMARKYWPNEDPTGKQVGVKAARWPVRTIIGVIADVKHLSLREEPAPEMYVPYTQNEIHIWPSMQTMQVALRAQGDPLALAGSARAAVRAIDPSLPLARVASLESLVEESTARTRFATLLVAGFGVLALILATVGIYGVISYGVAQRTHEIGIRMALGAQPRSVFAMVMGQGARLAGVGIVLGFLAAAAVTRLMATLLFGVQPTDPVTFAAVAVLLLVVTLLACYVPARRATRVDPIIALRYD